MTSIRRKRFLVFVSTAGAALAFMVSLSSQEQSYGQVVERIRDEGLNRSRVMDYAWYLADVIGPRLAGSDAMRESQEWAKAEMDAIGLVKTSLEPFGEPVVNWDVEYVALSMLEPDYQPLIGFPQAFTSGTGGESRAMSAII